MSNVDPQISLIASPGYAVRARRPGRSVQVLAAAAAGLMLAGCNIASGKPYPASSGDTKDLPAYTKVFSDKELNESCGETLEAKKVPVLNYQIVNAASGTQIEAAELPRDQVPIPVSECEGLDTVWVVGRDLGPRN